MLKSYKYKIKPNEDQIILLNKHFGAIRFACKTKLDRDLNASKNIFKEGIKIISSGTDDHRRGDEIRPVLTGTIGEASKKKELVSRNLSVFTR